MIHVAKTGAGKMESIVGAGFWSVCHGYNVYQPTNNDKQS